MMVKALTSTYWLQTGPDALLPSVLQDGSALNTDVLRRRYGEAGDCQVILRCTAMLWPILAREPGAGLCLSDKNVQFFQLARLFMIAELLPVRLAQVLGDLRGEAATQAAGQWMAQELRAALAGTGADADAFASRLHANLASRATAPDISSCYRGVATAAARGMSGPDVVSRVVRWPVFSGLWAWSSAAVERLWGELDAACGVDYGSPGAAFGEWTAVPDLVQAVAQIQAAAGLQVMPDDG